MTYITPDKVYGHLDRLAAWQDGKRPAPVTVEWDLSNRCVLGCVDCVAEGTGVYTLNRGLVSIETVNPGECVLAYDETRSVLSWARVEATSRRVFDGDLFELQLGEVTIRATGNHPFLTDYGWKTVRQLKEDDRVIVVPESLRVRMRTACEDERVKAVSRPCNAGDTAQDFGVEDRRSQSDAQAGGRGVGRGEAARQAERENVVVAEARVRGRDIEAEHVWSGSSRARATTYDLEQSNERPCRRSESERDAFGEWFIRTSREEAPYLAGRESSIPATTIGTDENRQPNEAHRRQGAQLKQDTSFIGAVAHGAMVRGRLQFGRHAYLDDRIWRFLGERPESGFQGSRSQACHRSHRRLRNAPASADGRELCVADHRSLRTARIRVLGRDAAMSPERVAVAGDDQSLDVCGKRLHRDREQCSVALRRIDRIVRHVGHWTVFNLQTSTGTYVAADCVTHNCHFAHTHVKGPWASRARFLPMAYESTGEIADMAIVREGLKQMRVAGVESVVWSGGGEPTTHPQWLDAVREAHRWGLQQGMYTLGGLLTPGTAGELARLASWVVVSLDAADAATYGRDKGVPDDRFQAACDGIRWLADAKSAVVGVSFLLHAGNWRQVGAMLELARRMDATYATFRPVIRTSTLTPATCEDSRRWIDDALPQLRWLSSQPDVECKPERFEAYRDWKGRDYDACHGIKLTCTITPDGRVWVCQQRRGIAGSCVGDLRTESFHELWQRHPGAWTAFGDCRVMCRLHLMNERLAPIFAPRAHGAFV